MLFIIKAVTLTSLLALGVGLSNAFGLIVGLLLMGYGLVGTDPLLASVSLSLPHWAIHYVTTHAPISSYL